MKKKWNWEVLESKIVFDSPYFKIRADKVKLPNKTIVNDYTIGQVHDVVNIFALTRDNNVIFVRQYRHGAGKILLQLPAGAHNKQKEDPKKVAARELLEETGYKAKKLIYLGKLHDYPSKMSHQLKTYFTRDVKYLGKMHFDITEDIETVMIPLKDVAAFIEQGKITAAGTIASIFLALRYLKTNI